MPQLGAFSNRHLLMAIAVSALLQLFVLTLPAARALFATTNLSAAEWTLVLSISLVPVTIVEVTKIIAQVFRVPRAGRVT